MTQRNYLFQKCHLSSAIDGHRKKMLMQIENLQPSQLLSNGIAQVCAHFIGEFQINPLLLHDEHLILIEPHEVDVEHYSHDWGRTFSRRMLQFKFELPFEGDAVLFGCCPSRSLSPPPEAEIEGKKLIFVMHRDDRDSVAIKRDLESQISSIRQHIEWQRESIDSWNTHLAKLAENHVSVRRDKLVADKALIEGLGFAVRRRGDPPASYNIPIRPKSVIPPLPKSSPGALSKPDPAIDSVVYEEILDTLSSMSVTMERSPSAFVGLDEESLRMQFLIPLNSKFQGMTSGETFNAAGKTDILIKHADRILFVAECKFWKGAQSLTEAIDQLLSYLTWRETKAAILLFNRNKDFSAILTQISPVFAKHPHFVRQEPYNKESCFRFILRSSQDPNRHLVVTLLAFNVPTK